MKSFGFHMRNLGASPKLLIFKIRAQIWLHQKVNCLAFIRIINFGFPKLRGYNIIGTLTHFPHLAYVVS